MAFENLAAINRGPGIDHNMLAGLGQRANRLFAQGQQNQLVQQQAQRDEQFRNTLAEFIGPDQAAIAQGGGAPGGAPAEIPPEAMNQLMAIDPERATQLAASQQQQQLVTQQQDQIRYGKALDAMKYVLAAGPGKAAKALEVAGHIDGNDFLGSLVERGVITQEEIDDGITDSEARAWAEYGVLTYAPMAGVGPAAEEDVVPVKVGEGEALINPETGETVYQAPRAEAEPTALESKIATATKHLGRPLTETEVLDAAGISAGQDADDIRNEQIPPDKLATVIFPDGTNPTVGDTWGEAIDEGANIYSAAEVEEQKGLARMMHTLDRLESQALDPETGVFIGEGGSWRTNNFLARALSGLGHGIGHLAGTEAKDRREIFNATSQGTLSSLVRSLGESGALSDGDVQRAMELIPTLGAMPDTERKARAQFNELRAILSRGQEALGGGGTGAGADDDVQIEWLD